MTNRWQQFWLDEREGKRYGNVLYRRAVGELPEMECSKVVARIVATWIQDGDSILDAGCGVGHYLRSLKRQISCGFSYTGVDDSPLFIDLARKAFPVQADVNFEVEDIYQLSFPNNTFDIIISSNVFLHLPSIERPLQELVRVARKYVLIRTLVGERSFRIQEVRGLGDEFDETGMPRRFNFFNIYSRTYIEHLLRKMPHVEKWEITPDNDFDLQRIVEAGAEQPEADNVTSILGNWQVNGYILQPWAFIKIFLPSAGQGTRRTD